MRLPGTLWPGPRSCDLEISLVGLLSKRGKRSYIWRFRGVIEFLHSSGLSQSCVSSSNAGKVVASGAGKSTVIKLLAAFHNPEDSEACRLAHVNEFVERLDSIKSHHNERTDELLCIGMSIAGHTNPRADKNKQLAKRS